MANMVHNLEGGRRFHCFNVPARQFGRMRQECAKTDCFAENGNIEQLFDPETLDVLCQAHHEDGSGIFFLRKLPDGHVVVERDAETGDDFIHAFIRDKQICQPPHLQTGDNTTGIISIYALAHEPGVDCPRIRMMKNISGILPPNDICPSSLINHAVAKAAAGIPLSAMSRVIFDSPNLGSLRGVMLKGANAHLIKSNFLKLVTKTNAVSMYDIPIKVTEELSSALMLTNPEGHISCAKIKNGILGYRVREADGGKTFIFVCNSNDFFNDKPTSNISESTLQLFKMSYTDLKPTGARISIQVTGNEYKKPPCKYNTPLIHLGMTVQDVLNVVEFACRNAMLDNAGCSHFPAHYIEHQRLQQADSGGEEDDDNEEALRQQYQSFVGRNTVQVG